MEAYNLDETNLRAAMRRRETRKLETLAKIRSHLRRAAEKDNLPREFANSQRKQEKYSREDPTIMSPAKLRCLHRKVFGGKKLSWLKLVHFAGLISPSEGYFMKSNLPLVATYREARQVVINDLRSVAKGLGDPDTLPNPRIYRVEGRADDATVREILCGDRKAPWWDVAKEAGMKPYYERRYGSWDRESIIQGYRELADKLGYKEGGLGPSGPEVEKYMAHPRTLARYVGPISELAETAGYLPPISGGHDRRHRREGYGKEGS